MTPGVHTVIVPAVSPSEQTRRSRSHTPTPSSFQLLARASRPGGAGASSARRRRRPSRRPMSSGRRSGNRSIETSRSTEDMEVEAARCECCGFTEECTPEYIAAVRAEYLGRWVCGLCAEAVGDEVRRAGSGSGGERAITTAEALDRHGRFAREAPRAPGKKAAEELVAAVSRLLRRCLDSPPASPAAPRGQKVAAGHRCPDEDDA